MTAATVAIVLAAGASRRLGRPKQLVELDGEPLVRRTARLALEVCTRVAVIEGCVPLADALRGLPAELVHNAGWAEGIASSIRAGIAWAAGAPDAPAALVLACDQLELSAAHLRALVAAGTLAASHYAGTLGIPAVFPRARYGDLLALRGDRGAARLLGGARPIDWPAGARDLDTPADLPQR